MDCPHCGKPAVREGDYPEAEGIRKEDLMWFCMDCHLLKRLIRDEWVTASREVIAVMMSDEVLEEMASHYADRWTWETDDAETKRWADALSNEVKRRRARGKDEREDFMGDTMLYDTSDRFWVKLEGRWI